MKTRRLGTSDIEVSEISLGCWTLGGLSWKEGQPDGWANVDEDDVVQAVKRAVDAGVNHFDNADVYGAGRAEQMLARVLKKLGLKSEDFIIATKIGHFRGTAAHAYEPAHIRHQCEQSLINLQRDFIDIYYFHHGDFGPSGEYLEEAAATMDELVKEGKVRIKGQSAYSAEHFERAVPVVKPQVLQSWANALDTQFITPGSPVANLLEEYNMSYVGFSPLSQGLLLDKYDPENPPKFEAGDHRAARPGFQEPALRALKPKLEKIKARFGSSTEDLAAVALNYILSFPNVGCVIPGFRNERQVNCNLAAAGQTLSADDVEFIRGVFSE
jgi:aryl-alcohol dehydrogenase-like predicted oxidoreductase